MWLKVILILTSTYTFNVFFDGPHFRFGSGYYLTYGSEKGIKHSLEMCENLSLTDTF